MPSMPVHQRHSAAPIPRWDRAFTQDGTASEEGLRRSFRDAQEATGLPDGPADLAAL